MNIPLVKKAGKIKEIPIVFILGHGRSGTTLLQSLLNSHPNVIGPPESDFIAYLYPRFGKIKHWKKSDIIKFVDALFFNPLFSLWLLDREQLTENLLSVANFADYRLLCKMVMYQTGKNKVYIKLLSDKNPINSLFVKKLLKIFPEAKFIHIIRDPRDSVNGHIKRLRKKNTFFLAWRWKRYNTLIEDYKRQIPNKFFTIKYENMVANIEETLTSLSMFLNIPYSDGILQDKSPQDFQSLENNKFFENLSSDKKNALFNELKAAHENSLSPVDPAHIEKWKNEMAPYDIAITEMVTGKFAKSRYGYEFEMKRNGKIEVSKFRFLKSMVIYYSWEIFTRLRYNSYKYNTRYKARVIRNIISKQQAAS
jgi:UDP-N-acetylglucosamine transferase subunit ALG13